VLLSQNELGTLRYNEIMVVHPLRGEIRKRKEKRRELETLASSMAARRFGSRLTNIAFVAGCWTSSVA
jgi:hypothetical protein